MNTWNKERKRTRDRLLEYDYNLVPPHPHSAGLPMIYPWESNNDYSHDLAHQLYLIAAGNGYIGDEETFVKLFGIFTNNKQVLFASFSTFPQTGDQNMLYFDIDEKILYSWDNEYIPVNAMLIANTTLEGGGA